VRDGIRTVAASLAILGIAAAVQAAIFVLSGSVALLADLIHNVGDALTAVPFGVAFFLRSVRGEPFAGLNSSALVADGKMRESTASSRWASSAAR
jgi:hypothetical protein